MYGGKAIARSQRVSLFYWTRCICMVAFESTSNKRESSVDVKVEADSNDTDRLCLSIHMLTSQDGMCVQCVRNDL